MISRENLKEIEDFLFEIPAEFRKEMKVPVRIYASEEMLEQIVGDRSLEQLVNVATLPGIQKYALAMPDIHQGYGFPIGGVGAFREENGVISPGGVGYDINCGVRLLRSEISIKDLEPHLEEIMEGLFHEVPSGVGRGGKFVVRGSELDEVLKKGVLWAVKKGWAFKEDKECCEEAGEMKAADPKMVSQFAKKRGEDQLGTLGSGNHFLEVQRVVEIFNKEKAEKLGIFKNQITVMIHSGSRGLGYQVCADYLRILQKSFQKWSSELIDRELIYAPIMSEEGQDYYGAMAAAANYAWVNRQLLTYLTREVFRKVLRGKVKNVKFPLVYDIAHNIAKKRVHEIDGKKVKVCVHRKGATRAFGPGEKDIPERYQDIGQPVIIPGSMGTNSYLLVGREKAMQETFGSVCHGAGRALSRTAAKKKERGEKIRQDLEKRGIIIKCRSMRGIAEEAPHAYKDIDEVVRVVSKAGLAEIIAKMEPLGVLKGD